MKWKVAAVEKLIVTPDGYVRAADSCYLHYKWEDKKAHCTIKEVNESNPKQPSCKKSVQPQECCCEKRCEIQSGGQEMAVMVG